MNVNYKTYVKYTINDDQFLTIIGVVGSIGSGFSRYAYLFIVVLCGISYSIIQVIDLS